MKNDPVSDLRTRTSFSLVLEALDALPVRVDVGVDVA